jgi:hypothetical protein
VRCHDKCKIAFSCRFVADDYFVYCYIILYCYVNPVELVRSFFNHGLLAGLTRLT